VSKQKREEVFRQIEAEQTLIQKFIDDAKRLSEQSDVLISRRNKASQAEGETEAI
jgi:hypothetical protein